VRVLNIVARPSAPGREVKNIVVALRSEKPLSVFAAISIFRLALNTVSWLFNGGIAGEVNFSQISVRRSITNHCVSESSPVESVT
jgi:hypothetical protein